jgi:hypothetical protein
VAAAKPGCGAGPTVPADSEIDQYAESIPGACGNQQNDAGGGGSGGGGSGAGGSGAGGSGADSGDPGSAAGSSIPAPTAQRLQDLGANGAGTQALAEANAPRIRGDADEGGRGNGRGGTGGDSASGGRSLLDPLLGPGDDGNGMGLLLPLILIAIAAAGAVFLARRRMSRAG